MDGSRVGQFAREARPQLAGSTVQRVVPIAGGMLLVLESLGAGPLELGLVAQSGAAWVVLLGAAARDALHRELERLLPGIAAPLAALQWRGGAAATPLDALRAWIVRPAPGHPGFARLESARLMDVEQHGSDRILRFDFEATDVLGQRSHNTLVCEFFDRAGNFVLCDAMGRELANWRGRPLAPEREQPDRPPVDASELHLSAGGAAHRALAARAAGELAAAWMRSRRRDEGRLARLLAKLEDEAAGAADAERWRQSGELLAANQHRVRRGQVRITVEDFFAGGATREIELDPTLSPQENVVLYFKRARRAERGQATIEARRDATRDALAQARAALSTMPEDVTWPQVLVLASDIWRRTCPEAIRTPLARLWAAGGPGWPAATRNNADTENRTAGPGRRFDLPGGWEVRVGRSNEENDVLTHRFARPEDIWMHASGVSGSHVVLRMQGHTDNPPRDVLEVTAAIAARFSKAKHAGTVPVVWTRKRYVRKPRGSKPGLAVCSHEKTLFVRPGLPGGAEE